MRSNRQRSLALAWRNLIVWSLCTLVLIAQSMPFLQALPAQAAEPAHSSANAGAVQAGTSGAAGFSVAEGATRVLDLGRTSALNVAGSLVNNGLLYIISTNPSVNNATVTAQNIFNSSGATITTVLPAAGLAGAATAVANLSMTLVAIHDILNQGSIISAGNLTVLAGGTITNAPAAGANASPAVMQAAQNLNVLASNIINQGVLASLAANVNIANPSLYASFAGEQMNSALAANLSNILNVNNTGGSIQALNGAVNIGGASLGSNAILSVLGGSVSAREINLNGGAGAVNGLLDSTVGTVNLAAGTAQFGSSSGTLYLGNLKVDGDPTFFNTGDITIIGDIYAQENLAIVASGDVKATAIRLIDTVDLTGQGHDIFIIAGGRITPSGTPAPVGTPNIPTTLPDHPLLPGQFVTVNGPSLTGGSISLAGSTVSSSSTSGNKNAGNITLVSYASAGKGGIENVIVEAQGSGTGRNGNVNVIAGGRLDVSNNAMDNVSIDATGGSSLLAAQVNLYAATPLGAVTFDSTGTASGAIGPGAATIRDILVGSVSNQGGNITALTLGKFANSGVVDTNGIVPGRSAGNINISAGTVDLQADLRAIGIDGLLGGPPVGIGLPGAPGQAGGNGGIVTIFGKNGINITGSISADGGKGGDGGEGGAGAPGQAGGAGGIAGNGGFAGTISLLTTNSDIGQASLSTLSAMGGAGGNGGLAAEGGSGAVGAAGGVGGNGGTSRAGGMISANSGTGIMTLDGTLDVSGAAGGNGGGGGLGGTGVAVGGLGGSTGISTAGGQGGTLLLVTTFGGIRLGNGKAVGGTGGAAIAGGAAGGTGGIGGSGGTVMFAAQGGAGGRVQLVSTAGNIVAGDVDVFGGDGGTQAVGSGAGVTGTTLGGSGGNIMSAGAGGAGGIFSATTAGPILINNVTANGGDGGGVTATAAGGGGGATGGSGGSLFGFGNGGVGGNINISANRDLTVTGALCVCGGNGGTGSATAGDGATGTAGNGGLGGSALNVSGNGGAGGIVTITALGPADVGEIQAGGGITGGDTVNSGRGGDGGGTGAGGAGGSLGPAGFGGAGGQINLNVSGGLTLNGTIEATGGNVFDYQGTSGRGGDGGATSGNGGASGSVGNNGSGGAGGFVIINGANAAIQGPGLITVSGGGVQSMTAKTGIGGTATVGIGGNSGNIGNNGNGGFGGQILISTTAGDITVAEFEANGGPVSNQAGETLDAGGGSTLGGTSGSIGTNGNGGAAGLIRLTSLFGSIAPDATISVEGGFTGSQSSTTGGGGAVTAATGNGGSSGNIGSNGNGGAGGQLIISTFGRIISNDTWRAFGGAAGGLLATTGDAANGGSSGTGGSSGSIGNNGNGGRGGSFTLTGANKVALNEDLLVNGGDVGGDFDSHTGTAGTGGPLAGSSGSIGNNGNSGSGGIININVPGLVDAFGQISAGGGFIVGMVIGGTTSNGGKASAVGIGGSSGSIGNNGIAGNGGFIFINSSTSTISLANALDASGGVIAADFTAQTGMGGTGNIGGASGRVGNNGRNGSGGAITISAAETVKMSDACACGGISGSQASTTLAGGNGSALSGIGGSIGDGSVGGIGGAVSVTSARGSIEINGVIFVDGGVGGDVSGTAGKGGDSSVGPGATGGSLGNGGAGGAAGSIILVAPLGEITANCCLSVSGGFGGIVSGTAGDGGEGGTMGGGGAGGILMNGGNGGAAGLIIFVAGQDIKIANIDAVGGDAGGVTGTAGKGGTGVIGGIGGSTGFSGFGGAGGAIRVTTNTNLALPGTITFLDSLVDASGGFAGEYSATAGKGGNGLAGNGGLGGSTSFQGTPGVAGSIIITGANLTITNTDPLPDSTLQVNGGGTPGYAGIAGAGGTGGGTGSGGFGGNLGAPASATNGGQIVVVVPGTITIDGTGSDSLAARGGSVGLYTGTAGDGGDAAAGGGNGGNGGFAPSNGNAGTGGIITLAGNVGNITGKGVVVAAGGQVLAGDTTVTSGKGGDAGLVGQGGNSGNIGNGGNGGNGGNVIISTTSGIVDVFTIIVTGADNDTSFNPVTPDAGRGGTVSGNGGISGSIGNNGNGGNGGLLQITTVSGDINPNSLVNTAGIVGGMQAQTGNGGDATLGNGGSSGSIGNNGNAGNGGNIFMSSVSGNIIVSKGTALVPGADVNAMLSITGDGGDTASGFGGSSGSIGNNGNAGNSGNITVSSVLGTVTTKGTIILRGGDAAGNLNKTGTGGDSLLGSGGSSGSIGNNGNGGAGGTINITSGTSVDFQEDIFAYGGIAASTQLKSETGNAGSGTIAGGSSGSIGNAGSGGNGGAIIVNALNGTINPTHFIVDGGPFAGGPTGALQESITGNAGDGGVVGGTAGSVGRGSNGGNGGRIQLSARLGLTMFSQMTANGGAGGDQGGTGGEGGDGTVLTGIGGSVGPAGNGGNAGTIALSSTFGSIQPNREISAKGGKGGSNSGTAGPGGLGAIAGGPGGTVFDSGSGGTGGTFTVAVGPTFDIILQTSDEIDLRGGDSGDLSGQAGKGGQGGLGGGGGLVGSIAAAGNGGTMSLTAPGGTVSLMSGVVGPAGPKLDGGNSGSHTGTAGDGGDGGLTNTGGLGGSAGGQGAAGRGGALAINSMLVSVDSNVLFSANGGDAGLFNPVGGMGGDGGGAGGNGGSIGSYGGSGMGGSVTMLATSGITNNGELRVNGGTRTDVKGTAGDGGDAGLLGGIGGNGGSVPTGLFAAGAGGTIFLNSATATILGTGTLTANGGLVNGNDAKAGNGGLGKVTGAGGNGGSVGNNANAGIGGQIRVIAAGDVEVDSINALGGFFTDDFRGVGGDGKDAGITSGNGGNGGGVGNNGNGGNGGFVLLQSATGTIEIDNKILADGGAVGKYSAVGGAAGSQTSGSGNGGNSGGVGNNGNGGTGGTLIVQAPSAITASNDWSLNGGSIDNYEGTTQAGGDGGNTVGMGGTSGNLGNNGTAGNGGNITVNGGTGAIGFDGSVSDVGGEVGDYTGAAGAGGNGGSGGGAAGTAGNNGQAGSGGNFTVTSSTGAISATIITLFGGAAGKQNSHNGAGGNGGPLGGVGGSIGAGTIGGNGGNLTMSSGTGNITVTGDITANGSVGGLTDGVAGAGGTGTTKGGVGGSVATAARGGNGGNIRLTTALGTVTTDGNVNVNGRDGGAQAGTGGQGGDGGPSGGNGGNIGRGGNGGNGGTVFIAAPIKAISNPPTAIRGEGGLYTGSPGIGGTGTVINGFPGSPGSPGSPGIPGTVTAWSSDDDILAGDLHKRKWRLTTVRLADGSAARADYIATPDEDLASNLIPISFIQPAAPAAVPPQELIESSVANLVVEEACTTSLKYRLAISGTQLSSGSAGEHFALRHGTALFAPEKHSVLVRTEHGTVRINAGSKALVEVTPEATIVRTLHDRKQGDVQFVTGSTALEVNLGRQLAVTDGSADALKQHDRASGIAVRNTAIKQLPGGLTAMTSEFSLISALSNHETLKALYHSSGKSDRKHLGQIMKNACVLSFATSQRGLFKQK